MRQRRFQPQLTSLESRNLLSITTIDLGVQGKILNLQGTDHRDVILIADRLVIVNGKSLAVAPDVIGIYADGNGGDDLIINLGSRPVILHGGAGDDLIVTVPTDNLAYVNVIYGDEGHNVVLGDPTLSAIFTDTVEYLTIDTIGPVAFFHDASQAATSIEVTTDASGTTHVIENGGAGETLLPRSFTVGLFDLGPGDDTLTDASGTFRTIIYGGPGDDTIVGDEVYQD